MFAIRFSSSTRSSNYPLKITALTVASPISVGHSKLQHFRIHDSVIERRLASGLRAVAHKVLTLH
jgi:hypothetical protein